MNNKSFFKKVKAGEMSLKDIFSDVTRKHSSKETAKVFIAGTDLTTPKEEDMLSGWQKPFFFARFFGLWLAMILVTYALGAVLSYSGAYYLLMVMIPFLVPVTILLLVWEMNVPRNISLYEIMIIVAIGGILSIVAAIIGFTFDPTDSAVWAGLIEEPAKLIIIYIILKRKNYRYMLNGILIGVAVGTGFAVMESLVYTFGSFYNGIILGVTEVLAGNVSADAIWAFGVLNGLDTAVARALTAVSGHGIYAGLYGGALVLVKGSSEIEFSHLLKFDFLKYFIISILLHALHNLGPNLGLPILFDLIPSEYLIIAVIAVCLLLPCLREGVNQVVSIASGKNGGRLSYAVNRKESSPTPATPAASAGEFSLQCIAGAGVGQSYRLANGTSLTIGRIEGKNDISLPTAASVSGRHCTVSVSGNSVTVTDLGSTNGTYVDDRKLTPNVPVSLANGSVISLGSKDCAFKLYIK